MKAAKAIVLVILVALVAAATWRLRRSAAVVAPVHLTDVVVASDDSRYQDYWPAVYRAWSEVVGVRPTLLWVADRSPDHLPHRESVVWIRPRAHLPTAFQAQCLRLLYPGTLPRDRLTLIADIDLLPLRRSYYVDPVRRHPGRFVCLRPTLAPYAMEAMSFCAAPTDQWRRLFPESYEGLFPESYEGLFPESYEALDAWHRRGWGWFCDQRVLFERTRRHAGHVVHGDDADWRRLDKNEVCAADDAVRAGVAAGVYSDAHLPPWDTCAPAIQAVLAAATGAKGVY